MGVDWEERVRYDRLREERLARIKGLLAASELGALLCFDMSNIRYITATHIGTWAQDKLNRFCLLPRATSRSCGTSARPPATTSSTTRGWATSRSRAGISTLRGAMSPESGRAEDVARKIRVELEQRGLLGEPVGIDAIEPPVLFALQREGIQVVDGQQLMQQARVIKTRDEITLLNMACAMVDAAYEELYRTMRPGIRENECVALVNKVLYEMGSEFVEGVNAISGERCSPHPHVFTDRALRPGDPAYFDILHSYMGYRTCYYRTLRGGQRVAPRWWTRTSAAATTSTPRSTCIRPGVTTGEVVEVWPKAQEFGFPDEEAAFALQFGHGVGLAIWEKPIFSRLVSLDHPEEIQEGMVFALETFWPASDGWSAAADRGAAGRHRGRLRGHHSLPRGGSGHRGQAVLHRRAVASRSSATRSPTATPSSTPTPRRPCPGRRTELGPFAGQSRGGQVGISPRPDRNRMFLERTNSWRVSTAFSRPNPLSFWPPNGEPRNARRM